MNDGFLTLGASLYFSFITYFVCERSQAGADPLSEWAAGTHANYEEEIIFFMLFFRAF